MAVGKVSSPHFEAAIDMFTNRLSHYIPFEIKIVPDLKSTRGLTQSQQKQKEGELIISFIKPGDIVVLLDERGKEFTSREFAGFIDKKISSINSNLIFVIGGPYGFSDAVYQRANSLLSLSKMTFTHEMARLFFVEQIYRAMTILRGEPYHHD